MFDLGFTEILLLGAIALIVLGPEKLPHAARMAGAWYARIRRSISNIQREIEQEVNGLEMKQRVERELGSIRAAEQTMRDEVNQIQAGIKEDRAATSNQVNQAISDASQPYDEQDLIYHPLIETLRQQRFPPVPYRVSSIVATATPSTHLAASDHERPEASTLNINKQDMNPP